MKSLMCHHSNESYGGLLSYTFSNLWVIVLNLKSVTKWKNRKPTFLYFFNFWVRVWNPKCVTFHSNESYESKLSNIFSNVWVRVRSPKCVTIQMKATIANLTTFLQTFGSVYEILNVSPFNWKLQRPTFLYFFKLLDPCMKS